MPLMQNMATEPASTPEKFYLCYELWFYQKWLTKREQ